MGLFSFGGYGLALAALALVVFGAYDSYPGKVITLFLYLALLGFAWKCGTEEVENATFKVHPECRHPGRFEGVQAHRRAGRRAGALAIIIAEAVKTARQFGSGPVSTTNGITML